MKTKLKLGSVIKKRPVPGRKSVEQVEVSDKGEIIGWCQTLKELGLYQCPGKCDECWCG